MGNSNKRPGVAVGTPNELRRGLKEGEGEGRDDGGEKAMGGKGRQEKKDGGSKKRL